MRLSSCTEWLFFHLWKKNPEKNNNSCQGLFIPDTIIYRWGKPFFWYFTTRDGQILRKTKERIFVENFEEVFNTNDASSDLIGMSLTSSEVQEQDGQQREKIEFEYYDRSNFRDYIYQREKTFGILQKFIEPKGHKNQIIKVTWSPQFCLLNRKTNIHDLNNPKINLNNKVATFEGSEYLTENDSITSPILSSDIEQLCINIVQHIQDVSGGNIQISRMVLFFKLDDKNRIWLQYCTNIKVREKYITYDHEEPVLNQNNGVITSSPLLKISQKKKVKTETQNIQKKVQVNDQGYVTQLRYVNDKVCANCQDDVELYDIKFNQIIDSFENDILDEETKLIIKKVKQDEEEAKNPAIVLEKKRKKEQKEKQLYYNFEEDEQDYYNSDSLNIPGLILKLWGKISQNQYQQLKQNTSWLQLSTKVCDKCFLKFTQTMIENKNEREGKKFQKNLKDTQKEEETVLFQIKRRANKKNNLNRNMIADLTPSENSLNQKSPTQTPPKKPQKTQKSTQNQQNPSNYQQIIQNQNESQIKQTRKTFAFNLNFSKLKNENGNLNEKTKKQQPQTDRTFYKGNGESENQKIPKNFQNSQNSQNQNLDSNNFQSQFQTQQKSSNNQKIKISSNKKSALTQFQKKFQNKQNQQNISNSNHNRSNSQIQFFNHNKIYNNKQMAKLPKLKNNNNYNNYINNNNIQMKFQDQIQTSRNNQNNYNNSYLSNSNASTMYSQRSQSQSGVKFMLETIKDLKNILNSEDFKNPQNNSSNQNSENKQQNQQNHSLFNNTKI